MRQAQLRNLEAKYLAERTKLEKRRIVTTTYSLRLAGVVRLESRTT